MAATQRKLLFVELGAFGFFGLFSGTFAVLLTDLSKALGLSPGPLGLALFIGAGASIVTMASLGWSADRIGRRPFLALSASVFGAGIIGLALADGYAALIAALIVLSAASGLYDVGINAAAVDLEQVSGRRFMSILHAAFSGGAVAGAISAGALLSTGMDYRYVYLLLLPPLAAVILSVAAARFPRIESAREDVKDTEKSALYRNAPLVLVAFIATLGLLAEGEMERWSGVYLRQSLGLSALIGGSGVAVFYGAMAAGRLGSAWVVARFGNRRTLLGTGLLTAAGMTLSLATLKPMLVVAGFLIVGLALSAIVPVAFSVAGDLAPERAGSAVSFVTTLGYGGFLLGPALIGGLAELTNLRLALGVIVVAGAVIFALALRLGRYQPSGFRRQEKR